MLKDGQLSVLIFFLKVVITAEKHFQFDGLDKCCTWTRMKEPVVLKRKQKNEEEVIV